MHPFTKVNMNRALRLLQGDAGHLEKGHPPSAVRAGPALSKAPAGSAFLPLCSSPPSCPSSSVLVSVSLSQARVHITPARLLL